MAARKAYDAIIVGSGASGGIVAKLLCESGASVLMLEAGPLRDKQKDYPYHKWPYEFRYRGALPPQERPPRPYEQMSAYTYPYLFVYHRDEPYSFPEGRHYNWWRARAVGGRTLFWGRVSLRFNEWDFKGKSRDGAGEDWPISYQDVAPYYDKVEEYIGVAGNRDNHEDMPDGRFLPPAPMRCTDMMIRKACERIGISAIHARKANLTADHRGRLKCHYCGHCGWGCETNSFFTSVDVAIADALRTKRLTLRTHAQAAEVLLDPKTGRARGVRYIDRKTHKDYEEEGRLIVLACGTLETARLMLNSKSPRFPNGIANSSGMLGKNFMEHIDADCTLLIPQLRNREVQNEDGYGSHLYIPWFGWKRRDLDFVRGYHVEVGGGFGMFPAPARYLPGFGLEFKRSVKDWYGTNVGFHAHGEMLPSPKNYVEIDPEGGVDRWGVPILKIHLEFGENELKMFKNMIETYRAIADALKAEIVRMDAEPQLPGASIHEVGTARMGNDPRTSVLNPFCQAHDVKNLFVVDGSSFVSISHKNPTLTIMALAWRSAEYMIDQVKKLNL